MDIIIKGDISGIQDFIFNVQSKGAAKSLRARSFFIDAVGLLAEKYIIEQFEIDTSFRIYNGGGNFYLKIPADKWDKKTFDEIQKYFLKQFYNINLSVNLSYISYDSENYGEKIGKLNRKVNFEKLSKYQQTEFLFKTFEKNDHKSQEKFIAFSQNLVKSNSYTIQKTDNVNLTFPNVIKPDKITLFGYELKLYASQPANALKIFSNVPVWSNDLIRKHHKYINKEEKFNIKTGSTIEFEDLAEFARARTGTAKIAALKLDIDNLGTLFQQINNENENIFLSKKISEFFTDKFFDIINNENFSYKKHQLNESKKKYFETKDFFNNGETIPYKEYILDEHKVNFKENLYVVFAGGDDSFIIGAWDAILEFAILLRKRFADFESSKIRQKLKQLSQPITFSASIILIDDHFPILKMAELAEDELYIAKKITSNNLDATGKYMKNKISLLNHVFDWNKFDEIIELKNIFYDMIARYGEERAFLHKLQELFESKDKKEWNLHNKPFNPRALWLFKYIFRDIKKETYFSAKSFYSKFFNSGGIYKKHVWNSFTDDNKSGLPLPVASKWTELLTKKI
ncbi:MAG: hypothetical protein GXO49_03015 [Chlorobi bacterium]|nr:hypothetical protein [Chlorobiota bacterium]